MHIWEKYKNRREIIKMNKKGISPNLEFEKALAKPKEENKQHMWTVKHPELGELAIKAESKYDAVIKAAKEWRVPWSKIVKRCDFYEEGQKR